MVHLGYPVADAAGLFGDLVVLWTSDLSVLPALVGGVPDFHGGDLVVVLVGQGEYTDFSVDAVLGVGGAQCPILMLSLSSRHSVSSGVTVRWSMAVSSIRDFQPR